MPSIYDLAKPHSHGGSVLVVGSGESRQLAGQWAEHFDAVACVQQAALDFPGLCDYLFLFDWQPAERCRPAFDRADWFICPEQLLSLEDQDDRRSLVDMGLPLRYCITFPVQLHRADQEKAHEQISQGKLFSPWMTTPTLLSALALLGFRDMFLLGCSDLQGQVSRDYIRPRHIAEFTAETLERVLKCCIHFWTPDSEPTRWRQESRGYLSL